MPTIRGEKIYPAASTLGVGNPNVEALQKALLDAPPEERAKTYFLLGNKYLEAEKDKKAKDAFEKALEGEKENSRVLTNLAVSLKFLGKFSQAKKQLKKAVELDSEEALPYLHLADAHKKLEEYASAEKVLKRMLKIHPTNLEGLLLLGEVAEKQAKKRIAHKSYSKAFELDKESLKAANFLARQYFFEGKEIIEEGKFEKGISVWAKGDKLYPDAFKRDKQILLGMKELLESQGEQELREKLLFGIQPKLRENSAGPKEFYPFFVKVFFTFGLMPEMFCEVREIEGQKKHWLESLNKYGEHPYPHYRMGVLHAFQGEIEKSLNEFLYLEDRVPKGKQESLKLAQILSFMKMVHRISIKGS